MAQGHTDRPVSRETYEVQAGTTNYGWEYESKVATLLCLRFILTGFKEIKMSVNEKMAGKFDDIVFRLEKRNGKLVTLFMQLKHQNDSKDITKQEYEKAKGDFSIRKYFESIRSIKQGTSKNMFIIFTNRNTVKYKFLQKCADDILKILNTNANKRKGTYRVVDCNNEQVNFYLLSNQIHAKCINKEIEAVIFQLLGRQIRTISITENFVSYITQWAKGDLGGHYYLTKRNILYKLTELVLSQYEADLTKLLVTSYSSKQNRLWNEIIRSKAITVVHSSEYTDRFLRGWIGDELSKYCHTTNNTCGFELSSETQTSTCNDRNVTFLDIYKHAWKVGELPLLLKVKDTDSYHDILNVVKLSEPPFKIIVIMDMEGFPSRNCTDSDRFENLSDLSEVNQQKILQLPIKIQGRVGAALKNCVNASMYSLIKCTDIINVLCNNFNAGNKLKPLPEYFIQRTILKRGIKVEALRRRDADIFVITRFFKEDLAQCLGNHPTKELEHVNINDPRDLSKVLLTETHITNVQLAKLQAIGKPIHVLSPCDCKHFQRNWSYGSTENIKNFEVNLEIIFDSRTLSKYRHPVTIVSGAPGIGKSSLMSYLSNNITPEKWVLRIDFNRYLKYLRNENCQNTIKRASEHMNYFYNATTDENKSNPELDLAIFRKFVRNKNVIVLLDGFDEVSVMYRKEATDIVKSFNLKGFSLWLTTRQVMKQHLEETFKTTSITLKPFTIQEQQSFLKNYFLEVTNGYTVPEKLIYIEKFVNELLEVAQNNLNSKDAEFTGIPLQIKLLADVFKKECIYSLTNSNTLRFSLTFDLLYLYEHFMESKREIYFDKFGELAVMAYEEIKEYLYLFALLLIFRDEVSQESELVQKLNKFKKQETKRIQLQALGIITIDEYLFVDCIHRTFAEFLSAEWLSINLTNKDKKVKKLVLTLAKERFMQNNEFLFTIFDRILARDCPLHLSIITNRLDETVRLIQRNPSSVTCRDNGQRSALHMLALYGSQRSQTTSFFDFLKNKSPAIDLINLVSKNIVVEIETTPDILGYTSVDYALSSGSYDIAKELYEIGGISFINAYVNLDLEEYLLRYLLHTQLFHALLIYFVSRRFLLGQVKGTITVGNYLRDRIACETCISSYSNMDVCQLLTSRDGSYYTKYNSSTSFSEDIHYATILGSKNNVLELLSSTVDINKRNLDKCTPLHCAVSHGRIEMVKILLKEGATVNCQNIDKNSPLHLALLNNEPTLTFTTCNDVFKILKDKLTSVYRASNHKNMIKLLISKGANADMTNNNGDTPLHLALEWSKPDAVDFLIDRVSNIYVANNNGDNPIHIALKNNSYYFDIAQALIKKGVSINESNNDGYIPLHLASMSGKRDAVVLLLNKGANINELDSVMGNSPLHLALLNDDVDILELLISKGANINVSDNNGRTPLHLASRICSTNTVDLLINKGANINKPDNDGCTPLHLASWTGKIETLVLLINRGANINEPDNNGCTPLHLASRTGKPERVVLLIDKGANINKSESVMGDTPLHIASLNDDIHILKLLISKGADINVSNNSGRTPLHLASKGSKSDTVDLLINKGANVNEPDNHGSIPLHLASWTGKTETVVLLINNGACVNEPANDGCTPLHLASWTGETETVVVLINKGANIDVPDNDGRIPLHLASRMGQIETVVLLINKGANIDESDNDGRTPLHLASLTGKTKTVVLLINKGANTNEPDNDGRTPLHLASLTGKTKIVVLLINKGANINEPDNDGHTPLHLASRTGKTETVALLLNKGANINEPDDDGRTPLHLASWTGETETVDLLVNKGASINEPDNDGCIPLHLASTSSKRDTVGLLINNGANNILNNGDNTPLHLISKSGK